MKQKVIMFLQHYFSLQQARSHLGQGQRESAGVVALRNTYFDGQVGAAGKQQRSLAVMCHLCSALPRAWWCLGEQQP